MRDLPVEVAEALITMSPATIDRLLKPVRVKYKGRGRTTTKPGTLLRKQIPIKTYQWDEARPGFLEADTVAHCGTSMAGMVVFTIGCVDIATGWTEQRALLGKGQTDVLSRSTTLRYLSLSLCLALTVITAQSSSTITS